MNPTAPVSLRLRALLGTTLALSLAAVGSQLLRPSAHVAPLGVVTSQGSSVKVEARMSHPAVGANTGVFFSELTVTLDEDLPAAERVSMAVVLDRSGSMSGAKMDDARRAVHRLIDRLSDGDELALVSFSSDVTPGELVRIDAEQRARLHRELDALVASGGTNVEAGLNAGQRALSYAKGAPRLVLISDGQPTEGQVVPEVLRAMVQRIHQGVTVSALGVGTDYDGQLLSRLAEAGGGMVGHLTDSATLDEVLGLELSAARTAAARNVSLDLQLVNADVVDVPGRTWESTGPRTLRISLADLRPHVPTRVMVNLRPGVGLEWGDEVRVNAQVQWRFGGDAGRRSSLAVALPVVDTLDEGQRDEALFARGVSALANVRLLAAASAYERGDDATASGILDEARGLFGMSADALAGQTETESLRRQYGSARGEERKLLGKGLQKKSLATFGRENEGY